MGFITSSRYILICGAIAAVLASTFGVGWLVNGLRWDAKLAGVLRDHAEQTARNGAATLHRYTEMERKKDAAIKSAEKRATENASAANLARTAADGLRGDLATVPDRIAAATRAAVVQYAVTVSDVLGACTDEAVELAGKADGHSSDVRLMLDSRPR